MGVLQNVSGALFAGLLAPVLMVGLAERFGWRHAMYIVAVPGLLMALVLALFLRACRSPGLQADKAAEPAPPRLSVRQLLGYRNIWQGTLIASTSGLARPCCLRRWHCSSSKPHRLFGVATLAQQDRRRDGHEAWAINQRGALTTRLLSSLRDHMAVVMGVVASGLGSAFAEGDQAGVLMERESLARSDLQGALKFSWTS